MPENIRWCLTVVELFADFQSIWSADTRFSAYIHSVNNSHTGT